MPGAPASISVVSQPISFAINTSPGVPLVAKVVDANGNAVSGVTVTFMPKGNGALCSFAGGANSAVTNAQGVATSAAITANGVVGSYLVEAWVGTYPPASGAVGPAIFSLPNSPGYAIQNIAAVQAAWTAAKAHLATFKADLATLMNTDLSNLEADRDLLYQLNAPDVAEWLAVQIEQAGGVGSQPRSSAGGGTTPQVVRVMATNPAVARDLSLTDQRPVTITPTAQVCQLS